MNFDRLRQALIKKAIEGTLVPPLSSENAINIYPLPSQAVPFSIPPKWQWVPLKVLCTQIATGPFGSLIHKTDYVENGIPIVNPANMSGGRINLQKIMQVDRQREADLISYRLKENDIVIARRGDLGRCALVTKQEQGFLCGTGSFFIHLNHNILPDFFLIFFSSETARRLLLGSSIGTTMPNLNHSILKNFLIPLPPIEEQHRIVARLNELLSVIKQAEDAYTDLQSLGKTLRERILQKAIEGKLVPQLDEEPAVRQIGEAPDEIPFAIPLKWKWEYLQTISTIVAGQSPKGESLNETSNGMEFHQGKTDFSDRIIGVSKKFTTEPIKIAAANSVLMSVRAPVGDVNLTDRQLCIGRGLFSISPQENIELEFLFSYLQTTKERLESLATGTTFKAINGKVVRQIPIPVPPLAEQRRIVAKLNELLPLVDQMTAV